MPGVWIWSNIIERGTRHGTKKEYSITGNPGVVPTHPGEILCEDVLPMRGLSVQEVAGRCV